MAEDEYIEGFFIKETEKARLVQIGTNVAKPGPQVWVPKSQTDYFRTDPIPDHLIGKIPGKPAMFKVAPWLKQKLLGGE